jgi:hypothetical protein
LRSTSPAIGKGTAEHAPLTDAVGKMRVHANGVDIGAYQFN